MAFEGEKTVEMLVDPDMHVNYTKTQVEQFIQVDLLCTQSSPMERPKMSDVVVRMLEDDGWLRNRASGREWKLSGRKWSCLLIPPLIGSFGSTENLHDMLSCLVRDKEIVICLI